jgi:hypothetical protein
MVLRIKDSVIAERSLAKRRVIRSGGEPNEPWANWRLTYVHGVYKGDTLLFPKGCTKYVLD